MITDVAIDQGGCIETIHGTTHQDPTYLVDGVIHYGVTNMPGAVAQTSTFGLTNVTMPYALKLANLDLEAAKADPASPVALTRTLVRFVMKKWRKHLGTIILP